MFKGTLNERKQQCALEIIEISTGKSKVLARFDLKSMKPAKF